MLAAAMKGLAGDGPAATVTFHHCRDQNHVGEKRWPDFIETGEVAVCAPSPVSHCANSTATVAVAGSVHGLSSMRGEGDLVHRLLRWFAAARGFTAEVQWLLRCFSCQRAFGQDLPSLAIQMKSRDATKNLVEEEFAGLRTVRNQDLTLVAKLDVTQIEEEKKFKEAAEAGNERKLECLRLKVELDFQRQKDDLQRLEQDLSILKSSELSADRECILMLRMEREETQSVKKGKHTIKDNIMKKLTELENALRKASGEVDRVNSAVRKVEAENAEMEACKLSASESATTFMEVAKREKKCLKKISAWEKQKSKL
nr:MND1-interacting protein 1 [Ipomoea batatas]